MPASSAPWFVGCATRVFTVAKALPTDVQFQTEQLVFLNTLPDPNSETPAYTMHGSEGSVATTMSLAKNGEKKCWAVEPGVTLATVPRVKSVQN